MEHAPPAFEPPYRVLVLMASTAGWYAASTDVRKRALEQLRTWFARVEAKGARLVGSFDDDLFATGQPLSLPYSIYALYDVDDLGVIVESTHELRSSELTHWFRLEARVGRKLFLLDG
jgi:hypothetical protein